MKGYQNNALLLALGYCNVTVYVEQITLEAPLTAVTCQQFTAAYKKVKLNIYDSLFVSEDLRFIYD